MTIERLDQLLKNTPKAAKVKGPKAMGADFGGMLDAASAMSPVATTAGQLYGNNSSAAVLAAAFSGISAGASTMGSGASLTSYGTPSYAGGFAAQTTGSTFGGLSDGTTSVIPGTEGFTQMDMINTMNQNNLQLLELQATMQSNMQGWNTKSNILSADHRARMAMIEKFTARG
ncbi:MAG: hypothetical protein JXA24_03905 [Proteobacteria bacterium]|nr:hypothetical protein [Pseudomonadota bacterium]